VAVADGVVRRARIAVGGVADRPLRATDAEDSLVGQPLIEEGIAAAARHVAEVDDGDGGDRAELASVLARRALEKAAAKLRSAS
jgi:CO/xanthine dehydrogenase FAD-binding subunit